MPPLVPVYNTRLHTIQPHTLPVRANRKPGHPMSQDKPVNQAWGGRFGEATDAFVARFTASVRFDQRLYRHDIMGSIAHATMLAKVGVLTAAERDSIIAGLEQIRADIEAGTSEFFVTHRFDRFSIAGLDEGNSILSSPL